MEREGQRVWWLSRTVFAWSPPMSDCPSLLQSLEFIRRLPLGRAASGRLKLPASLRLRDPKRSNDFSNYDVAQPAKNFDDLITRQLSHLWFSASNSSWSG